VTAPWWAAVGPAEAQLSCGAGQHRVRWTDGMLRAVDHPDAEGELVLAALGGAATPCLDLVRIWARHTDDLFVLTIGPRSADDRLAIAAGPAAHPRQAQTTHGAVGGPLARAFAERAELPTLMALGQEFQFRLCGAVAHAWSADGERDDMEAAHPVLNAALAGRFAPVATRWLGIDPDDVETSTHAGSGWGAIELTTSAGGQTLHGALPVSWLARVWAPGLAVVSGHLVVSVLQAAWPVARVLALERPGGGPVELRLQHAGGAWSVAA
jgi:hypothetical protein